MSADHESGVRHGAGQAMAEFLVCAALLSLLLLALPVLRDFQRQQIQLIQTARRAAFFAEWRHWQSEQVPGLAGIAHRTTTAPLSLIASLTGSPNPFPDEGYQRKQRSRTVVAPEDAPEPFHGLSLRLTEQHTQLGGTWAAADTADVARRVRSISIAGPANALGKVLSPALQLLRPVEPALAALCLGIVEPDVVPADRLGAATRAAYPSTHKPC